MVRSTKQVASYRANALLIRTLHREKNAPLALETKQTRRPCGQVV